MVKSNGINQTPISFKCDSSQLELFDDLCKQLGVKRNKLLNFLVVYANVCLNDPQKLFLLEQYSRVCFDVD